MTALRRDGNDTPFSAWIRSEPRLDSIRERLYVSDCDYWIHQYRAHRDRVNERLIDSIMLVELKTFSAGLPWNQRDTLRLVNEGFRRAFRNSTGRLKDVRMCFGSEVRIVHFHGAFLLRLSGDRPDNSDAIEWHGRKVDLEKLVDILRFAVDPLTLRPRSLRRHHLPGARQAHPELFVVGPQAERA